MRFVKIDRALRLYGPALVVFGSLIAIANMIVAFRHIGTRYHLNHVSGAWTALTWYTTKGFLYPPLYEDGFYGGTRFAPLSILVNAGAAMLTGELFVSSKIVAIIMATAMVVAVYAVIRRIGAPRAVAFVVSVSILATEPGFAAFTSPFRGDPAPIVLQLIALTIVAHGPRRTMKRVVVASAICAIAVFFKMTAGFAVIAIGLFLLVHDRRQLAAFCVTWFGIVLVLGLFFHVITDGRMVDNLFGVTTSNLGGPLTLLHSPGKLNYLLNVSAGYTLVGFPLVLISIVRSLRHRRISMFQVAWLVSCAILCFLLTDSGVSINHMLAFIALTAVALGEFWVALAPGDDVLSIDRGMMLAVVCWLVIGDADRHVVDDLRMSLGPLPPQFEMSMLDELASPEAHVLSEEPSAIVMDDKRPVVLDAWMVTKIAKTRPGAAEALKKRVEAQEFDRILLLVGLDEFIAAQWYTQHFGWDVIRAIQLHYREVDSRYGFHIWERRSAGQ